MQENRDGSFGPNENVSKLLDHLRQEDLSKVKAIHFGTIDELEEIKKKKSIENRVGELEDQFKSITQKKSDFIIEPTREEIKQFGSGPMRREMLKAMNIVSVMRK